MDVKSKFDKESDTSIELTITYMRQNVVFTICIYSCYYINSIDEIKHTLVRKIIITYLTVLYIFEIREICIEYFEKKINFYDLMRQKKANMVCIYMSNKIRNL